MSAQNVIAFVNKVNGDHSLQAQVASLSDGVASLVQFAAEAGFTFTADEWNAMVAAATDGLNEGDLSQVSGGLLPAVKPPQELVPAVQFTGGVFQRFS